MMNKFAAAIGIAAGMLLAGCSPDQSGNAGQGVTSLVGMKIGAPFALTDQNGGTVRWSDLRGKYVILYFGYTYCPDVCPLDLQNIMRGYAKFEKEAPERAARVQPLFISVDPERDTPVVLKTYVGHFHPRLVGLTGTPTQIADVAKAFAVVYGHEEADKNSGQYLVSHTRTPYLFGPDGKPLALVPVDDPATPISEGNADMVAEFLSSQVR